jgi:hypothetical protein
MAAETIEVTESDEKLSAWQEHVLTDLHEALRLLTAQGRLTAKHDAMLEDFRPLLEQFRSRPAAAMLTARRARRNHDSQ